MQQTLTLPFIYTRLATCHISNKTRCLFAGGSLVRIHVYEFGWGGETRTPDILVNSQAHLPTELHPNINILFKRGTMVVVYLPISLGSTKPQNVPFVSSKRVGPSDRTRTCSPMLPKHVRYHLRYARINVPPF